MTVSGGLLVAIDLATRRRDAAGQALAQVLRRHEDAVQQLTQLQNYACDTQGRWSVSAQTSTSPQIVGHYYQFMDRLEQTVGLQQGVIAEVLRQCHAARQQLLDAEVALAGLTRLRDKRRQEQAQLAARREQRQTDAFASRRAGAVMVPDEQKETR
jgi:flagellar FliJ protein